MPGSATDETMDQDHSKLRSVARELESPRVMALGVENCNTEVCLMGHKPLNELALSTTDIVGMSVIGHCPLLVSDLLQG